MSVLQRGLELRLEFGRTGVARNASDLLSVAAEDDDGGNGGDAELLELGAVFSLVDLDQLEVCFGVGTKAFVGQRTAVHLHARQSPLRPGLHQDRAGLRESHVERLPPRGEHVLLGRVKGKRAEVTADQ